MLWLSHIFESLKMADTLEITGFISKNLTSRYSVAIKYKSMNFNNQASYNDFAF
jgi:hypothetical protein